MANAFDYLNIANESSIYRKELMKENYVNIKFYHDSCVRLYAQKESFAYKGETYILMDDYTPTYNNSLDCFEYDIMFKAWYYEIQNKIFKLNGTYSAEWDLTAKPSVFFDLLATNTGITFVLEKDINNEYIIDKSVPFITLSFNGTNCLDALDMIVKALDPECGYYEWWSNDNKIYIGKLCSSLGGTELEIGTNIVSLSQSQSNTKKIDRLYAFGSIKNISARYGSTMVSINADHGVYDDDGKLLGWQDPNHIIKPTMFRTSARNYHRITSTSPVFSSGVKKWENTFYIPLSAASSTAKSEIFTFDLGDIDIDIAPPNNGEGYTEVLDVYVDCGVGSSESGAMGYTNVGQFTIGGKIWHTNSLNSETISIQFPYIEGAMYENETPCLVLVVRCYLHQPDALNRKQPAGREPDIDIINCTIEWEARGNNYSVTIDDEGTLLNPHFYQESDVRARVFNDSFAGIPDNIIKSKCPSAWFPLEGDAIYQSAKVTKRLTIPMQVFVDGYICKLDQDGDEVPSNGVESQVIFDDIYPSVEGTLGSCSVKSEEEEDSNGLKTGTILNYYTFVSTIIKNITTECFIDNTAKIVFKSGKLNGMEFELNRVKSDDNGTTFCIIPNDNYGVMLPNATLYPESNNKYTLIGIDISLYEDNTILSTAQQRLLNLAVAYFNQVNSDQNLYTCKMAVDYTGSAIAFGQGITLKDINLDTRVIGIQHPLDLPLADYQVICGNSQSYRRIAALENKTLSLK